jgi:hypothetical protein
MALFRWTLLALGLAAVAGCNSEPEAYTVTGRVTFEGAAVTDGTVQLIDPSTGKGGQATLSPDGGYELKLGPGRYEVMISPPLLTTDGKTGPPMFEYKKVPDIPERYRNTVTSGLTAAVAAVATKHDFAMKK